MKLTVLGILCINYFSMHARLNSLKLKNSRVAIPFFDLLQVLFVQFAGKVTIIYSTEYGHRTHQMPFLDSAVENIK